MARNRVKSGVDALVVIAAVIAIAVFANVLAGRLVGRLDLTDNHVNSLSQASKDAAAALDDLEVRVYISPNLPETITDDRTGQKIDLHAVEQKFRDTLQEYQSNSQGHMTLTFVTDDVVAQAKAAKLQLFAGQEATAEGGRLEFKKYALGATFHYGDVMEVLPQALYPEFYEFEISKRLIRLKKKAEEAAQMADILAAGKRVTKATKACVDAIEKVEPKDDGGADNPFGLLNAAASKARVDAYVAAGGDIKTACDAVDQALTSAAQLKGTHRALDSLLMTAEAFAKVTAQFVGALGDPKTATEQAPQLVEQVKAIGQAVADEHDNLEDSPGRKAIGFVCVAGAFCPFPSDKPLIPAELKGMLGQKNPFIGQILPQLEGMAQQIDQTLAGIQKGLFERKGFDIERLDLDGPIPDHVAAVVILGARDKFTDYQLYALDQFVLRGGSLVAFVNNWDVSILNATPQGDMDKTELVQNTSNIGDLLGHFGVRPNFDLVAEPKSHDDINLMAIIRQGQLAWRTQRPFPYPLLPRFTDFDQSNPLVRSISTLTLPFTSSLELSEDATPLVRSTPEAVSVSDANFPLLPPEQADRLATMKPEGKPLVVAAVAAGKFTSYFQGKDAPKPPDAGAKDEGDKKVDADATRVNEGTGRVLVIGSNLGLEDLSVGTIFKGFSVAKLTDNALQYLDEFRGYSANLQNWQVRLQQIRDVIPDGLQFLFNALDWAVQDEALISLRSKQYARRPLVQTDDGDRTRVRVLAIGGGPLLVLLLGLALWAARRARRRRVATLAGSTSPFGVGRAA